MHRLTLAQLSQGLAQKTFSSVELTTAYLKQIAQLNPTLNAYVTVDEQGALVAAKNADATRAKGQAHAMAGIPIAHKDIFCTKGLKTSCGSRMLDNFIAPYDATVVTRFKEAGTVLLGKTNMDEFAMGSSNETSFYGPCFNPWDTAYVPGGSSGGSAAVVAAGLAAAATGTDTGGSIRQPAALCGVTGLKPTYGRVSRFGMIAFASSLDQGGPLTRTAEDAALMLSVMAGFDDKDSTSADVPVPDYSASLGRSIKGLRIGVPKEFFDAGLDAETGKAVQEALGVYESLGAKIVSISLPLNTLSVPAYYVVAPAECSSNLSRYDGVRFGHRCETPKNLEDLFKRSRSEGFGAEVQRRILVGTYVLSAGFYDAYYVRAQKIRHLISQDFAKAFKEVDVIMGPTSPEPAFKVGEKASDPVRMYLSDIYTIAVNLAGLPGISIPCGMVRKMPVGLQIISPYFSEELLLNVAHQYQQATDWHTLMPTVGGEV